MKCGDCEMEHEKSLERSKSVGYSVSGMKDRMSIMISDGSCDRSEERSPCCDIFFNVQFAVCPTLMDCLNGYISQLCSERRPCHDWHHEFVNKHLSFIPPTNLFHEPFGHIPISKHVILSLWIKPIYPQQVPIQLKCSKKHDGIWCE